MKILYNGNFSQEEELRFPLTNRAFQFNDGFFETMMVVNGTIRFWQDHLDRIHAAAKAMQIVLPAAFTGSSIEKLLLTLAEQNGVLEHGRLRLQVWRGGAGIYTPETNAGEWLAIVQPAVQPSLSLPKVGICRSIRTNLSPFAAFKGPNALLYVQAGIEKKARALDDLILLSKQDQVAELTSSNIFWFLKGTLYTPALDTGCVHGIMRRNIMQWCQQEGIKIKEVFFDVEGILPSDVVFAANVTGIKTIEQVIGFELNQNQGIIDFLRSKIEALSVK